MIIKNTAHYHLLFFDNYVIAEANEGTLVNNEVVAEALKVIFDHFDGNPFSVISNRKNNYTVDVGVYALKLMKKLKALAIVSNSEIVKEKAFVEQLAFNQSFTFFEDLEDAKEWALSVAIK
ncbi:hypothetical protein BH23BAC2_BH23BAC2_22590 [soil metagenome]